MQTLFIQYSFAYSVDAMMLFKRRGRWIERGVALFLRLDQTLTVTDALSRKKSKKWASKMQKKVDEKTLSL